MQLESRKRVKKTSSSSTSVVGVPQVDGQRFCNRSSGPAVGCGGCLQSCKVSWHSAKGLTGWERFLQAQLASRINLRRLVEVLRAHLSSCIGK